MTVMDAAAETAAQQIGQRLRHVRENAGLRVDVVAAQLRMPKSLVLSLEEGDWSRLGGVSEVGVAPVVARCTCAYWRRWTFP